MVSTRSRRAIVGAALAALVLSLPSPMLGADPPSVTYDPAREVADPAADAAKAAAFSKFLEASPLTVKAGAVISPQSPCPLIVGTTCTPAAAKYLTFTRYHQKTDYYCLPTSIQSILHSKFGGYVSPSVKGGQDAIYATTGKDEGKGLAYINTELKKHTRTPSDWLYASATASKWEDIWNYVIFDAGENGWPTWARVNWNDPDWPDHSGSTAVAGHASVAMGYDPTASPYKVRVYDPWSYVKSDGAFYFGPSYSSAPDSAGYWTAGTDKYYSAFIGPLWY